MGDHDVSADISKDNEPSSANAEGSLPRLVAAEDDLFGNIMTYQYRCDQPTRFGRRKRNGSSSGRKAKAGQKPGRDGPNMGRADHSGARNQSSAGGT